MPSQSTVLLSQTTTRSVDFSRYTYTEKQKADGYYNLGDGKHTVVFLFDNFKGAVKIQATLAVNPAEDDWFPTRACSMSRFSSPRRLAT